MKPTGPLRGNFSVFATDPPVAYLFLVRRMKRRLVVVCLLWLLFGCSRQSPSMAVDFQTKKECAERAEAYLRRERSIDTPANGINAFIKNEQYKYGRSLNTCLLYFEEVEI